MKHVILGIVDETETVGPRKRIKYTVEENKSEQNYKKAFERLRMEVYDKHICGDIIVCSNCVNFYDDCTKWAYCHECEKSLCGDCLPKYREESDDKDIHHVVYCRECTEKGFYEKDTIEIEPAYQIFSLKRGGIPTCLDSDKFDSFMQSPLVIETFPSSL